MRSCPVGAGIPRCGDDDEAGLVAVVVLDVLGQHLQAVQLGCHTGGDRRQLRRGVVADHFGRTRRRRRIADVGIGEVLAQEAVALSGRHRDRQDLLDVADTDAGPRRQRHVDVEHDLANDHEIVIEGERVEGEVDHPFDRVLDRHEAEIDVTTGDRVEHIGHRSVRPQIAIGEIGLGPQRLLGEGAERSEERHARTTNSGGGDVRSTHAH